MSPFANTPAPPYYAVIFTSVLKTPSTEYNQMASYLENLAQNQDGFLGMESAREDVGITVSYWRDVESIKKWKSNTDHLIAQQKGQQEWYKCYKTRICIVERDYELM